MEKFIACSIEGDKEITVRVSAIAAIKQTSKANHTELFLFGTNDPITVLQEYHDVVTWIDRAEED